MVEEKTKRYKKFVKPYLIKETYAEVLFHSLGERRCMWELVYSDGTVDHLTIWKPIL